MKNYLFHRAESDGHSTGDLYEKCWRQFDEDDDYWRAKQGRGHARRTVIDTFLLHYLTMERRDAVPVGHVYAMFREHASNGRPASEVLTSIKRAADVYRSFNDLPKDCRQAIFFERLAAMGMTSTYPLMLAVCCTHGDDQSLIDSVAVDLESFLIRRMVCQLNTRGYNTYFVDLIAAVSDHPVATSDAIRQKLLVGDSDTDRWPNDEEFQAAWLENPLFRALTRPRIRMLLEALEVAQSSRKSERMSLDEKLTVEHVLPRRWKDHWPLSESDDQLEAAQARDRLLQTIGNLTLVTGSLNPALSNGPWDNKRKELRKHSRLLLNKHFSDCETWDEQSIRERGNDLASLACRIWPHPGDA